MLLYFFQRGIFDMKKIVVAMLLFAIIANLTACNIISDSNLSSSETGVVKQVASDEVLKINKEMTSKG